MLEHWISPPKLSNVKTQDLSTFQFGAQIKTYDKTFSDLSEVKIALVVIGDHDCSHIRSILYKLSFPFKNLIIADLGNVKRAQNDFAIPLIQELIDSGIVPIILSSDTYHINAQFKAHKNATKLSNVLIAERSLQIHEEEHYLSDMLSNSKSIFNVGIMGFQKHYSDPGVIQVFEKNNFDLLRVGQIKKEIASAEPIIRDADMISFNVNVVKSSDAPSQHEPVPSGLTLDEACQLSRYFGISEKCKSFGIYGFNEKLDHRNQTCHLIAQMIWYFVEGYYYRKYDSPNQSKHFNEYTVSYDDGQTKLKFLKSTLSGRWWLKILTINDNKVKRHSIIPCSYKDYLMAVNETLSDRVVNILQRFD